MTDNPNIRRVPWTASEVASLNAYQADESIFHPYTCGTDSGHPNLVATKDGWTCAACDYTQPWAHSWATDGSWKANLEALRQYETGVGG